ncbi:hypothetical protein [Clostridium sp. ZS2-4]|uniref:hypothetical protein n=1 Tax=Clostridium sp. ZS2-4 TaxID=2987703 RepID=UPI00227A178D|nr:hypothetical protein [Clostridium sp. ZS2-4]MCY6355673.1 hypothetical protein [Clostridium sp. ZS2-4]
MKFSYSYYILLIIFFILCSIISRVRKIKKQNKAVAIALREWDCGSFIVAIVWLLLAFVSFTRFREDFKQVYWLLVPKYISQWKHLFFHYDDLIRLENMFEKKEMYSEAMTVDDYTSSGLDEFYSGIIKALVGIVWLVRSFDKDSICKEGIYTKNGDYKWKNIKSYKWGELESKKSRKKSLQYYSLEFEAYSPIIKKVFKYDDIKQINMKISVDDKEKVEEFLKKNKIKNDSMN